MATSASQQVTPLKMRLQSIGEFGSRPYRSAEAQRALDGAVAGLRGLASYGGADDSTQTADLSHLVDSAIEGLRRQHRSERLDFGAAWIAAGDATRQSAQTVSGPPAPRASDAVVAAALERPDASLNGARRLLRAALAAEMVGSVTALRPVVDLYAMGALLATEADRNPALLREGQRTELHWSGTDNPLARSAPGCLRPEANSRLLG